MGITQLIEPFYKPLDEGTYRAAPVVGQIGWSPVLHLDPVPRILNVQRSDPEEHYASKFEIRNMVHSDFRKKERLPIKALSLRETEELVIHRAKKRLTIVVASDCTIFDDVQTLLRQRGKTHLQERSVLVAPIYSIENGTHSRGFPAVMVARTKALLYRQLFFCPSDSKGGIAEGVVRLDRLQTIIPQAPTWEPLALALSKEALAVFLSRLQVWFGAEPDADTLALEELVAETLPEEAKPAAA